MADETEIPHLFRKRLGMKQSFRRPGGTDNGPGIHPTGRKGGHDDCKLSLREKDAVNNKFVFMNLVHRSTDILTAFSSAEADPGSCGTPRGSPNGGGYLPVLRTGTMILMVGIRSTFCVMGYGNPILSEICMNFLTFLKYCLYHSVYPQMKKGRPSGRPFSMKPVG